MLLFLATQKLQHSKHILKKAALVIKKVAKNDYNKQSNNKKLLGKSAPLLVTGALLVVTRSNQSTPRQSHLSEAVAGTLVR